MIMALQSANLRVDLVPGSNPPHYLVRLDDLVNVNGQLMPSGLTVQLGPLDADGLGSLAKPLLDAANSGNGLLIPEPIMPPALRRAFKRNEGSP